MLHFHQNIYLYFINFSEHVWQIFHFYSDKLYPIMKIWAGFESAVIIRHPDDVEVLKYKKKYTSTRDYSLTV